VGDFRYPNSSSLGGASGIEARAENPIEPFPGYVHDVRAVVAVIVRPTQDRVGPFVDLRRASKHFRTDARSQLVGRAAHATTGSSTNVKPSAARRARLTEEHSIDRPSNEKSKDRNCLEGHADSPASYRNENSPGGFLG